MSKDSDTCRWKNGILTVYSSNCLVISDLHAPFTDMDALHRMLAYAKANRIKDICVVGDIIMADACSDWSVKDTSKSMKQEIDAMVKVLKLLCKDNHVWLCKGNHDERVLQCLKYSMSFSEWICSLYKSKNLTVCNFDFMYLVNGTRKWLLTHGSSYSRIKGSVATKLAQFKGLSVAVAHQHFLSVSTDASGRHIALDLGCCCLASSILYKRAGSNSMFPEWEVGGAHLKDSKVKLLSKFTF